MDYTELGLVLLPEFITEHHEQQIIKKFGTREHYNTTNRNNIQRYGSNLPYKANIISNLIPDFLQELSLKLLEQKLVDVVPDSITVNEYLTGQKIDPHIDTISSGKVITILSLGSNAIMKFAFEKQNFSVDLERRSLVQMKNEIRYKWTHAIDPVLSPRYSIVFRHGTNVY